MAAIHMISPNGLLPLPLELEALNETVVELGRRYNLPTSTNESLVYQQDLKHDVGGKFQGLERCAGALIALAPTKTAAKHGIAPIRGVVRLRNLRRSAMRAVHEQGKSSEYRSVAPHLLANRQS